MKKIIIGILIAMVGFMVGYFAFQENKPQIVGNILNNDNAYSVGGTYVTSTLTSGVATLLVPRATSSRTYAKVTVLGDAARVFIYKQATSTGVVVNRGSIIFASTTTQYPQFPAEFKVDSSDPYTNEIWGVSEATTSVAIEYKQE
jgi:hypothetical protein